MSALSSAPGAQERRFAAYLDSLAQAAEHADRVEPLKSYCRGLLLPGERKSVEPMAARLAPDNVRQAHQSLHHLVAQAPWSDEALLRQVQQAVLPAMKENGPLLAWVVDDTGFPKKGIHSVGVARQYCGQIGKQENCQIAVSLSLATERASLPIAWRLYLPESWAQEQQRRQAAGVPKEISFRTKWAMALEQIRKAVQDGVPTATVLADAAYGDNYDFRAALTEMELRYVVGVREHTTVWRPGVSLLPPKQQKGRGRPGTRLRRDSRHQPLSVKRLAQSLSPRKWKTVSWRAGTKKRLRSRFAVLRVRPAHRDERRKQAHEQEWLLIEWPAEESEPTKYWLSTLHPAVTLRELVKIAKHRWIIERDYQELKQELGLGHYEGRGWRGFHHHATLCIAAYGFLVAERSRFSPSARLGRLELRAPELPSQFKPRGSPRTGRTS
jgi:SRSO17 transposase